METKISMKTIYLLLVISIGLISLAVGSTFAVFTASAEIDNPISFTSNLSYTDNIFQTIDVTIPANSSEDVNFAIWNIYNSNKDINYTTWYIYDGNDNDISFTINYYEQVASPPSGTLDQDGNGVFLTITNNTSTDITLTMGVATNTEDIVLPNYMKIVSEDSDNTSISQDLILEKGTGVETIYYKVNGASSYTSSTSSIGIGGVHTGSTYYYYGTASTGYLMDSCTLSSPCSGTMGTSSVTKTLSATATQWYTITIVESANTTTTLETSTVSSGASYKYNFYSLLTYNDNITIGGSTTSYVFENATCTNGQTATITTNKLTKTLTIASVTADTTCTLYYTSSSSSGNSTS